MAEILVRAIVATTGIDRQGTRIPPAILDKLADQANSGGAIRLTFNHDRTLPPAGKGLKAYIEKRTDGNLQLVSEFLYFDKPTEIVLPDGTPGYIQGTSLDSRPFIDIDIDVSEKIAVYTDFASFPSPSVRSEFQVEIEKESGVSIDFRSTTRKAFTSPHEIILLLGGTLPIALAVKAFARKIVDRTSEKLSDEISNDIVAFYKVLRSSVTTGIQKFKPDTRPVTYVIQIPSTKSQLPSISFVIITNDPYKVEEGTRWEKLESSIVSAKNLTERYSASEIHYILDDNMEWKFNYLLSTDGKVIGRKQAFAKRSHVIKLLRKSNEDGFDYGQINVAGNDNEYSPEEENQNIKFLSENKQGVSFGGTATVADGDQDETHKLSVKAGNP